MDSIAVIAGLFLLFLFIGAILGWISYFKHQHLQTKVDTLERELHQRKTTQLQEAKVEPVQEEPTTVRQEVIVKPPTLVSKQTTPQFIAPKIKTEPPEPTAPIQKNENTFFANLLENWMVWLGGSCVGLAGIFLVRYSIEAGLLGPTQRIIAAIISGISLHVLAEWLRRKTGEAHPTFAALAGGASIILYAAMLAALHLYNLLSPGFTFAVLAIISILTMILALQSGPVLAIIGLLGGYIVPILVSSDSGNIVGAMIYTLIISTSALFLMRYVYRSWLWYGMLAGTLGWWLISLTSVQANDFRGIYLAIFAYSILAIPTFDWLLIKGGEVREDLQKKPLLLQLAQPVPLSLILIIIAHAVSIAFESFNSLSLFLWSPLIFIVLWACGHRTTFSKFFPWLSLIVQWFAWLYCGLTSAGKALQFRGLGVDLQQDFLYYIIGMVAIFSGMSWVVSRGRQNCHARISLMYLAPVVWFALGYLLVTDLSSNWKWGIAGAALSLVYAAITTIKLQRKDSTEHCIWLIIASHFAFSLAVAMFFREATLTLVLATQVVSLVYVMRTFNMNALEWIVKGVLALIVVRLTLNPWLLHYPPNIHWSLWTYGGAVICCGFATLLVAPEHRLKKWLEGATLHLFVLFFAAETRYWLYDGQIFIDKFTLTEAAINTVLWSGLGLVYYYRSLTNSFLTMYYTFCSRLLLCLAIGNYTLAVTHLNPLVEFGSVGTTPIWNLLLLAYGAPLVMACLCLVYYDKNYRKLSAVMTGITFFVFVNMEIRHLWQPEMSTYLPVSDGELYTYSIVWLAIAIATILFAAKNACTSVYKIGMALLLAVIGKIFLIDMSDLDGLLRVASFMGLGLSLLGLAYLYQKISNIPSSE
ncbi:MAG: DUF2339 domain-containing protein [Desulfotalea sp.]